MSSFLELPTIYGSVYFLPGVIVVVLLLLLLLLMSSRRRAKGERARLAPGPALAFEGPAPTERPREKSAPLATQPGLSSGVVTQPVAMTAQPAGALAQQPPVAPVVPAAPAAPALGLVQTPVMAAADPATQEPAQAEAPLVVAPPAPAPGEAVEPPETVEPFEELEPFGAASVLDADPEPEPVFDLEPRRRRSKSKSKNSTSTAQLAVVPAPEVISATDPLSTTVQEILDGWGELTPEDMKRLELFRPDALNAALAAVQLPKSKSEDAKVRLTQMRQYGIGLERRADAMHATGPAATAAAAVTTAAAVVATAPAASTVPPAATAPAAMYVTGAARTQVMAPGAPAPSFSPIVAPLTAPVSRSFYDAEPVDVAPQREEERPVTEALADIAPATTAPTAPLEEVESEAVSRAPLDEMESLWAEPRPIWEPDPEPAFEEMPAPMFDEIEMEPASTQGVPLDTTALSAALNVPMGMPDRETPTLPGEPLEDLMDAAAQNEAPVSKSPLDDDLFWEDELPAMSRLSDKVETAEQLMAQPAEDRADMTAFLPPTELAAAFRATQDPGLKRAVIDTLENIGTPASLNALGNCFEDADPEIQTYALAAADRLLGVV